MNYINQTPFINDFSNLVNITNLGSDKRLFESIPIADVDQDRDQTVSPILTSEKSPLFDLSGYPIECLILGTNCPNSIIGSTATSISSVMQKFGILLLSLLLVGFGLYLMVASSKTGQAVINVASKI